MTRVLKGTESKATSHHDGPTGSSIKGKLPLIARATVSMVAVAGLCLYTSLARFEDKSDGQ